jgi:uncharacterized membrane protein
MILPTNLKRLTAHPMLWGTAAWGAAHLLANGDLASLLLFGSVLCFALFDMVSANRRGARPSQKRASLAQDALVVAVSALNYVALLLLHPWLFGVAVLMG